MGNFHMILDLPKHAGEDLQAQIFFIAQSVCASLNDADLIVQAFNEPEGDLVLGGTIRRNPLPMAINHLRQLFVGFKALPLQGNRPVLKEAARPAFLLIVPQLAERLLEQVSGLQPLVSTEQDLESAA